MALEKQQMAPPVARGVHQQGDLQDTEAVHTLNISQNIAQRMPHQWDRTAQPATARRGIGQRAAAARPAARTPGSGNARTPPPG